MIVEPPSDDGADQLTTAEVLAATAVTDCGAVGLDDPLLPDTKTRTVAIKTIAAKTEAKTAGRFQEFPLMVLIPFA